MNHFMQRSSTFCAVFMLLLAVLTTSCKPESINLPIKYSAFITPADEDMRIELYQIDEYHMAVDGHENFGDCVMLWDSALNVHYNGSDSLPIPDMSRDYHYLVVVHDTISNKQDDFLLVINANGQPIASSRAWVYPTLNHKGQKIYHRINRLFFQPL